MDQISSESFYCYFVNFFHSVSHFLKQVAWFFPSWSPLRNFVFLTWVPWWELNSVCSVNHFYLSNGKHCSTHFPMKLLKYFKNFPKANGKNAFGNNQKFTWQSTRPNFILVIHASSCTNYTSDVLTVKISRICYIIDVLTANLSFDQKRHHTDSMETRRANWMRISTNHEHNRKVLVISGTI